MTNLHGTPDHDARYLAVQTKDARFDGRFFTAVTTTGIYCRPVCRVRAPKQENCRFFDLAAQAESAGFRPCLRCRPELSPSASPMSMAPWSVQDASSILARQAALLLDTALSNGEEVLSIGHLSLRLGVSERHLRRIFEAQWGVSPLQYLQTRRLLNAKQLLTDTPLPIAQVALLSGFASVRSFNTAFSAHYRMEPRSLRKHSGVPATALSPQKPVKPNRHALLDGEAPALQLRACYRPPYDVGAILQFFATRSIAGLEVVDVARRSYARTLQVQHGSTHFTGWVSAMFALERCSVEFQISQSLAPVLPAVLQLLKGLFDLDADPQPIHDAVGVQFPLGAGLRVPGTVDGFELGVRAILGQQITVAAARTLIERLTNRFGEAISTPHVGLNRLFPTAHVLAHADGGALGELGIVRQRQTAILGLAQAVSDNRLQLRAGADVSSTMAQLEALPGIGPWTANYIAMRALRWPDAFPAGDVALQSSLGVRQVKNPAVAAELASQKWRPWRSYAVVRAWAALGNSTVERTL
ncbi:DNA-3-methyladenine glycosylase 2 family protein [Rhodoferax aquaticus]|uniref:DNA-3-methyladenine glycosylase II n=1 Tax=Rhodoferax aquaticus TaxID=2527691 RepID=A0A515EMJ2_9BURK|nr:Ada metal-binding domain-containing protein [Rhodoferax aquaticus]QDL53880.1 DNA-3-methyladenine glycosylase 2 family protein [Rhodoferax aquaticus]